MIVGRRVVTSPVQAASTTAQFSQETTDPHTQRAKAYTLTRRHTEPNGQLVADSSPPRRPS